MCKLDEQVARVQVSQSFVNTGSRAMEVCFVFPLPYDGAVDQLTLLIDGKEMPAKLLEADEARQDVRRDRPQESRSGAVGMDGHGPVQNQRVPGAAGRRAKSHAALFATVPQVGRADRFHLPAVDGQVHVAAGRGSQVPAGDREPIADQERLQPEPFGRYQAARRQTRHDHLHRQGHGADGRFSLVLRRRPGHRRHEGAELSAQGGRRWLLPAAGQPADQSGRRAAPQQNRRAGDRSLGQHERREDRAGQGGGEVRDQQSARGRSVQPHRLRQRSRQPGGPSCNGSTTTRARRPWVSSKAFMPAAARTSTAR